MEREILLQGRCYRERKEREKVWGVEELTLGVGLVGLPTLPRIGLEGSACSDKEICSISRCGYMKVVVHHLRHKRTNGHPIKLVLQGQSYHLAR